MMPRWRRRRIFTLGAVTFCVAACLTGCETDDPPPPKLIQTTEACIAARDAERRFDYVADREGADDVTSARAVLEILLTDCDAAVRNRALEWLKHLPSTPPPRRTVAGDPPPHQTVINDPPTCPDKSVWDERFGYAEAFRKSGDLAAAVTLLQGALGDCDASVRKKAWEALQSLPSPPATADCPAHDVWKEHFAYGDLLIAGKQYDGARQLLTSDLTSCNAATRNDALVRLKQVVDRDGDVKPPAAAATAPSCAAPDTWKQRFAYADQLKAWGDIADARGVLATALSDCNGPIRDQAIAAIKALTPPSVTACAGPTVWEQRFDYAEQLRGSGDSAGTRDLLKAALGDCDPAIRAIALRKLSEMIYEPPSLVTVWNDIRSQAADYCNTTVVAAAKALALLVIGYLIAIGWLAFNLWRNRKRLRVEPLTVAGAGFDAQLFVTTTTHVSFEMAQLEWLGAYRQRGGRATLGTDATAAGTGLLGAANAFAGDAAGKIIAALVAVANTPRYRATGSIYLNGGRSQIVLRLNHRSVVRQSGRFRFLWFYEDNVWNWEETGSDVEIAARLKQRCYEMLLAAGRHINHDRLP